MDKSLLILQRVRAQGEKERQGKPSGEFATNGQFNQGIYRRTTMQTTRAILRGPSPVQIQEMATAFWISKALFTGLELDIFETLVSGPMSCEELATRLNLPVDSLQRLLTGLAALELVERVGEGWSNTLSTQTWLVRSSPEFLGGLFGHFSHDLYPLWRYLPAAVCENGTRWQEAFGPEASHNPFETMYTDPIKLKKFLETMDALVQGYVTELLQAYDFSSFHRLMDVPRVAQLVG